MPPQRVSPRPIASGRRLVHAAVALACAVTGAVSGAFLDGGSPLPETAVAAPASPQEDTQDAVPAVEDVGAAGVPLADLLLVPGPDAVRAALPHDAPDLRVSSGPRLTVPVLMYHYIRVNPVRSDRLGATLSVTPHDFAEQMAALRRAGVRTVSLGDVVTALGGGRPLPPRAVVLTFDDGYGDFSTAAMPVLQAEGFRATVFVVSGFVGRPGYMTAADVVAAAAAGMTIGAHTVHHVELAHIPASLARAEIEVSRQQLEELSGQPVDDFAYPYGDTSRAVAALVQAAGFHDAVTTAFGATEQPAQQFALSRVRVEGGETLATFASEVLAPLGVRRVPTGPADLPSPLGVAERAPGRDY
jgi:peptidoglycan/xylan/chitin deacetylase (PgdA/CDA1 family)